MLAAVVAVAALTLAAWRALPPGLVSERGHFVTRMPADDAWVPPGTPSDPPPIRVAVEERFVLLAGFDHDDARGESWIDIPEREAFAEEHELVPARPVALCVTYDHTLARDVEVRFDRVDRVDRSIHDSARDVSTETPRGESLRVPRREIGSVETIAGRLAPGRYQLSCRLDASAEISVVGDGSLQVEACSNQEIVIPLRVIRGTETLRGRIVEPSGSGIRGAQIRVEAVQNEGDRSLRVVRHVASTRDGSFELKGLSDVPCRVDVMWTEGCMNPCAFGFTKKTVIAPSPREVLEIVVGDLFDVDVFVQHSSVEGPTTIQGEFDVLLEPLSGGDTRRATATRPPDSRTNIVSFQHVEPGPYRVRVIERGTATSQRGRTFEVESAAVRGTGQIQVLVPVDP
jgi:hypothetical protein